MYSQPVKSVELIDHTHVQHANNWLLGLSTFSANATSELDVLGHDGDTLGMYSAQVGVLKERHEIGLSSFLEGENGGALKAQIGFVVLGDFTDQTLEGELADQEVRGLLILANFTKSHGTRSITMWLLDTGRVGALLRAALVASCLRGALPPVDLRAVCLVRAILGRR